MQRDDRHSELEAMLDRSERILDERFPPTVDLEPPEDNTPPVGESEEPPAISPSNESEDAWPAPLALEAFHGVAGDFVRVVGPHTEADPAALLVQFLVACGNVLGRNAYFQVEADHHYANLFAVLVGATSKGRKGTGLGHVRRLIRFIDEAWDQHSIQSGLSSGEGLIWAVRDAIEKQEPIREKKRIVGYQTVVVDQGIEDKRLLTIEPEFAAVLRMIARDGCTLSPVVRLAWDKGDLQTITKNSPARATGAHVSIIGHVTRNELRAHLTATDSANGFANRFLWICSKRSKCLPEGGSVPEVEIRAIADRLRDSVTFARSTRRMTWDEHGRRAWHRVYPDLSEGEPGLFGAVTNRAEAQVLRLSLLYAVLDGSAVVRLPHLKAALAVWGYCEASARYVFGDRIGDEVADEIDQALRKAGNDGLTRTDISSLFGRNRPSNRIREALNLLITHRRVRQAVTPPDGQGRPAERWFSTVAR